jgi:hypothetical protein
MLSIVLASGLERRRYTRIECRVPAVVSGHRSGNSRSETAEIIDYGPDGICLLLSTKVSKGQRITVDQSHEQIGILKMRFEIRWVKSSGNRYLVGAERVMIAEKHRNAELA